MWFLGGTTLILLITTLILFLVLAADFAGTSGIDVKRVGPRERGLVEQTVEGEGNQKILLISLHGIIADLPQDRFIRGEAGLVAEVRDALEIAKDDASIHAVILSIDSPGGGVTASDVLYHELATFRKDTQRPVIALLNDVAASGGYYVASACDRIIAHPTTVTGSIGVIMPLFGVEELLRKIGVDSRVIKSGDKKDIGSMFRLMTEEERGILQEIVSEYYDRFVSVVEEGFNLRGIDIEREKLMSYCDGRIFSGEKAKEIGFVDDIGYFEDAVQAACDKAGLGREGVKVVTYRRRPGLLDILLSSSAITRPGELTLRVEGLSDVKKMHFMYLWTVGMPESAQSLVP